MKSRFLDDYRASFRKLEVAFGNLKVVIEKALVIFARFKLSPETEGWRDRHTWDLSRGEPPASPLGYFWRLDVERGRVFLWPG